MTTSWNHPDLIPLLRAQQSAKQMLADASEDARTEIEVAIADIHRELGERLAKLATAEGALDGPIPLQTLAQNAENSEDSTLHTDDVPLELDTYSAECEVTPIPESTPISDFVDAQGRRKLPPPVSNPQSKRIPDLPEHVIPSWMKDIITTMHLLESPRILHAYTDLSAEMTRILWATHKLESFLAQTPSHLAGPLLGLLASRCHHIATQIELQWGPEVALDYMRVAANNHNLDGFNAFENPPVTEYQNWFEEAQHWWDVLAHGMQAQLR